MLLRVDHSKLTEVDLHTHHVTFHNLRDFSRTIENYEQKQHRISDSYDANAIAKVTVFVNPFAFHDRIGHTILGFEFKDGRKICVSVEGQARNGETYSFWKALLSGYRSIVIRGTEKDIICLRVNVRKEKVFSYPLHITTAQAKKLFLGLASKTNAINQHHTVYKLISNNCTSALRYMAREFFPIPYRHYSLLFAGALPQFLSKLGLVELSEGKRVKNLGIK